MAKLVLSDITSGYASVTALNDNFALIETALENTLSRDGTTPNTLSADLDMNGFNILNQANPVTMNGFNWEGDWLTGTTYQVGDVVQEAGAAYICIVEHTAGTFATDLAAAKWQLVAQANLPTQAGNAAKFLQTDGSNSSWQVPDSTEVNFTQAGTGAVVRTMNDKAKERVSVKDFGAVGDGVTDDSTAINAAISAVFASGGGVLEFPSGTYLIGSTINLKSGVTIRGEGYEVTTIKLATNANTDMIVTEGFGTFANLSAPGVPKDFGIERISLDGNYLDAVWNNPTNTINNSFGYGIKVEGIGFTVDVELKNIPEVGLRIAGEEPIPTTQDAYANVKVFGRVFGKEGMIITGPNDFEVERAWFGLCGLLPRPAAETTFATSTEYPGQPVAGVVLDGANVEVGRWHVYACWSGPGVQTRNTVRLAGNHIISESNNAQINFSSGTFGAIGTIDLRNLAIYHPNWSAATPSYTSPDPRWDAFTCASQNFQSGSLRIFRSITAITRVPGTNGLVCSGTACLFNLAYSNSSPVDPADPEFGSRYSGSIALVSGSNNALTIAARNSRGDGVNVTGNQNVISATLTSPQGYGVQSSGGQNIINAVVASQAQDGGVGAAFRNAGAMNTWNTTSTGNSVPYESSTGLNRVAGYSMNSTLRSFTIAAGVIQVTTFDNFVTVDTEGAAATDDLDTINGGARFQRLTIAAANSGRDVVLKDATGNMRLAGDFTLTYAEDRVVVEFDGNNWCEISRSDNTA